MLNIGYDTTYVTSAAARIQWIIIGSSVVIYLIIAVVLYYGLKTRAKIFEAAFVDPITQTNTRAAFEVVYHENHTQRKLANYVYVLLNIKGFKRVLDLYGYDLSDTILKKMTERLIRILPKDVSIYRLQNDDFIVVINKDDYEKTTLEYQLIHVMDEAIIVDEITLYLGTSIAVYQPSEQIKHDPILTKLSVTLSEVKRRKDTSLMVYNETLIDKLERYDKIEQAIRDGITTQLHAKYEVVYQPKVDILTSSLMGFEALSRLSTESLGTISPIEFIEIAEQRGLIDQIGNYVLHQVCQFLRDAHESQKAVLPVSINVSMSELAKESFVSTFIDTIDSYALEHTLFEIEITETSFAQNFNQIIQNMQALSDSSIKINIDEFGTGYSSLSYLQMANIDDIKLDTSFISNLSNEKNAQIVKAVIAIASSMNAKVVAEGVETEEQSNQLKAYACHFAQGYYFYRPMKAIDALHLLKNIT